MRSLQERAKAAPSMAPRRADILNRKCACGQHTIAGSACADCRKQRQQGSQLVKKPMQRPDAIGLRSMSSTSPRSTFTMSGFFSGGSGRIRSAPLNVPLPVSRRVLKEYLADYYGTGKSIFRRIGRRDVGVDEVSSCNLSDLPSGEWAHKPQDTIGIDPVLGRL